MKKYNHPIFFESLIGAITIIVLSSFLLFRGFEEKKDFFYLTGNIVLLDQHFQELPIRHAGKFRYLKINNYPKVFEIFIGKDFDDFKPAFEQIDQLKYGDLITVYFDEDDNNDNESLKDERINRVLEFIDKGNAPFYIRGEKDKILGVITLSIGIILLVAILILKHRNKIL